MAGLRLALAGALTFLPALGTLILGFAIGD